MHAHKLHSMLRRRNLLPLTAFFFLALIIFLGFTASGARTQQDDTATSARDERKFENTLGGHVPIKVKLKSEKSFKDLKNKSWARDLELEVKNTGSKPIHYIYVILDMPDVLLEDGVPLSFRVKYGRHWLSDPSDTTAADEKPILPGESVTLKIPENKWKAYEAFREEKNRTDPKRIRLELQIIDFGDGTGLESIQGVPLTYPRKKSSLDNPPAKERSRACQPPPEERVRDSTVKFLKTLSFTKPASLLRANFFLLESSKTLAVISVGRDSPYGHPHAEALARWRGSGAQVLTTGERGLITVCTDGEDLLVETFVRR